MEAEAPLREHGIALVAPKTMRRDLTPLWRLLRDGTSPEIIKAAARAFVDLHGGDAPHIVMMDENILGSTDRKMLIRKGKLYPWAHHRVGWVMSLLESHDVEIAIAVRNLADFLPSCWSESLHHGAYTDFRDFLGDVTVENLRWSELIARIHEIAPDARLRLWSYESYGALREELFAALLGEAAAAEVRPVDRVMRPGISAEAAAWLARRPSPDKAALREARKRFPKEAGAKGFDPWSAAERDTLTAAYRDDLAEIGQQLYVHMLRP